MKLRVLKNRFLHEEIGGRMCHFPAGTVFDHPDEKRAASLLTITPPIVEKAPLSSVTKPPKAKDEGDGDGKGDGKGKGKGSKKDQKPKE